MDVIEYMSQFIAPDEVIEDLIAEMEFITEYVPKGWVMPENMVDTRLEHNTYQFEG